MDHFESLSHAGYRTGSSRNRVRWDDANLRLERVYESHEQYVMIAMLGSVLTLRCCGGGLGMGMRRMTRLTNAFSKKLDNLQAAYFLWFAYYNFCRIHKTLRVTPAMESGIPDRIWSVGELWSVEV
jgi:hypothetical protein